MGSLFSFFLSRILHALLIFLEIKKGGFLRGITYFETFIQHHLQLPPIQLNINC